MRGVGERGSGNGPKLLYGEGVHLTVSFIVGSIPTIALQIIKTYETAWCGRHPVTVEIDQFETDIGRQTTQAASAAIFIMTNNLDDMLLAVLGSNELVNKWWSSPNRMFGYDTPEQAFRDRPDNVVMYISRMTNG